VAYQDGLEVRRTTRQTTGEAVSLVIKSKRDTLNTALEELAFLEVIAVDTDGNELPDFNEWINVEIQGGGTVVATDNGNPTDLTSFQSLTRKAYNGKLLIVVKGYIANGEVTVSAHSDGLKSGTRKLVME